MFVVEQYDGALVISPRCDLDLTTRDSFRQCLDTAASSDGVKVVVSLLNCTYVDSTALSVLATSRRKLGDRLSIVAEPGTLPMRILSIGGFDRAMLVFASLEQALQRVSP